MSDERFSPEENAAMNEFFVQPGARPFVGEDVFHAGYEAGMKHAREQCAKIADVVAEECRRNPGTCFAWCGEARCDDVAQVIRGEKELSKVLE